MESRFVVDQKSLVSLLSSMQPICTKRTTIDATSTILFQVGNRELVLKSTDLEISLQASCTLSESTITDAQTFLVSGKRIFDVVKELDGNITCELASNQIFLKCNGINLSLNIKDAQEFPPFPERIENLMHISAPDLRNMLDSVAFLIPQNNANSALNGLLLEFSDQEFTMTTTDGHCLARVGTAKYILNQAKSWLLPRRAIFELKKILETTPDNTIFLGICGNQLVFSGEFFNFFSKLLVDPFPNYRSILEKTDFIAATVDRSKFIKTLRRSACLLSGQFLATKFTFSKDSLQVSINNKEVGNLDEELPITSSDNLNLDTRFYSPYLLNGLQAFNEGVATFYLKNNSKPIIFESKGTDFTTTYLVMPVSPTSNR
ncbi:DNA polymerase III subunit beta [Candidatus Dependentiae bacterium]|nr:DNA polymerase III subunit beta [Candidatus Dependentiae bacterium]